MKYVMILLAMGLVGCAADRKALEDASAYLSATPYQHCQQPETAARYSNMDECKADIAQRQEGMRGAINNYFSRPAQFAPIQPYYLQSPAPAPRPVNCTTRAVGGAFQTFCQ